MRLQKWPGRFGKEPNRTSRNENIIIDIENSVDQITD